MLSTGEIVKRLDAPYQTVVSWIKRGLFPGAKLEDTPRGPVWLIPASALENFVRPPMGRPPKPKSESSKGKSKR